MTALGLTLAIGGALAPGASQAASFEIAIVDYAFEPAAITVHVGDPITWTNNASRDHAVASEDGELDSDEIGPGEAYGHVFETPGTFEYFCSIHPDRMQAQVTVLAAEVTPPPAGSPEPTPPTGTLPPNFSPFPSLGPIATPPTDPSSGPTVTPSSQPVDGGQTGGPVGALLAVAIAVAVIGAGVWWAWSRRRLPPPRRDGRRR